MRVNLVLALVLVTAGFILCTLSFVFLNIKIQQEPFSSWSELPYVGMFHYSGIICLAGAIVYLLMETRVNIEVNSRNLLLIFVVVSANLLYFFIGGYYALRPVFFLVGLVVTSVISAWIAVGMNTKDLVAFIVTATLVAMMDEYAHTSVGTLSYFDNAVPSPLTVLGWSIFMILIVAAARVMMRIRSLDVQDRKMLRTLPVVVSILLILAATLLQGYTSVFNWVLVLVYVMLLVASLFYTYGHPLKWNIYLMIGSLMFGFFMEYIGRWEGLWTFRFMEPVSLLILFSWPLRIWAVNAFCLLFNVDFSNSLENHGVNPSAETDDKKSVIVIADTHFGLKQKDQTCDPNAFSDFLDWVRRLEQGEKINLSLGVWGAEREVMDLRPPEKVIFLGDILEMWDASSNSIDVCTRSIVQSISSLTCEKVYVLGNHDVDLVEILGRYPLGPSSIDIIEEAYTTLKGGKKYLFVHGHQFDRLFTLPSWRILPPIRHAALTFGSYSWLLVALFTVDVILGFTMGFGGVTGIILTIFLGMVSLPFLIIMFGRDVWNNIRSTKYKPRDAKSGFEGWWNKFSKKVENLKNWNIVYGHTHTIDFWVKVEGDSILAAFNVPSWVRNSSIRKGRSLENVLRHVFLYIDDKSDEFIGWDTEAKKPFLIPKDVIIERRERGDLRKFLDIEQGLRDIGWPQELIEKFYYNVADVIA